MAIKVEFKNIIQQNEITFPYKSYNVFQFNLLDEEDSISLIPLSFSVRYSVIHSFHLSLQSKYNLSLTKLSKFPKKLFFNTEKALIERAKNLEKYFNELLSSNNTSIVNEVENFINSKIEKRNKFESPSRKSTTDTEDNLSLNCTFNEDMNCCEDNDDFIDKLLKDLSLNDSNISSIIENFIQNNKDLFTSCNKIYAEQIYKLLYGDNDLKGLIFYIGNCINNNNNYGSISCLNFIYHLINPQFNINFKKYRCILQLITKYKLKDFEFAKLLLLNNPTIIDTSFEIITCILEKGDNKFEDFFKNINYIPFLKFYMKWLEKKN